MSHSFGNIISTGHIGVGDYQYKDEDVHMCLHSFAHNGRAVSLNIDHGYQYDSGTSYGNTINLDRDGVVSMISMLTKWLAGTHKNSDYGEIDEHITSFYEKEDDYNTTPLDPSN